MARYLAQAAAGGEIPPQHFARFLSNLFWDYKNLIALYWLRDESAGYAHTSRLIDASLELFIAALASEVITTRVRMAPPGL